MDVSIRLNQLWEYLRASFWFLPTLMVLAAAGFAVLLIEVELRLGTDLQHRYPQLLGVTAQGARDLLTAIASSMITVAGVTFSITIVTLSLASSQYTSRVLRNFLRDRGNQTVLGVFVAIYVYCLVVLFTIRDNPQQQFVPSLAVLGGVVLAFCGIGFLIYFIHHIAHSIQASTIIKETTAETLDAINHLFPERIGKDAGEDACELPQELIEAREWQPVTSQASGYIQDFDAEQLLRLAEEWNTVVRMERTVGEFVVASTPLASILEAAPPEKETAARIHRTLAISAHRTIDRDPAFGIRQMVDIAIKALSSGVNDTTTANICLDHLTVVLARLIQRRIASPYRSTHGRLRIVMGGPTFADLLWECFEQIRQNAAGNVRVLSHLLHSIKTIAPLTSDPQRLAALRQQSDLIAEVIERTIAAPADKQRLVEECRSAIYCLQTQACES